MKKKGYFLGFVCIVFLVAIVFSLVLSTSAAIASEEKSKVFKLTIGTFHPAQDPINKVINAAWFKWLEKQSNGRIEMTLLPGGQAAPPNQLYDAARTHIVDLADVPTGQYADRFPVQEVGLLPMLFQFPGVRQMSMTMTALYEKYPEMQAEHPEVKVIAFHGSGPNHPGTTKKPIKTLDDWKGLMQIELGVWGSKLIQSWGATPVSMSPPEYPDALKKGTVDGISSSYLAFNLFGHIQTLNYITEASLYLEPFVLVMNKKTWDNLPPDLQKLFNDSFKVLPELYGYDFDKTDLFMKGETDKKLKDRGMPGIYTLPKEEMDKWKKAAVPIHEAWVKKVGAKIGEEKARAILEDATKFAEQYRYETTPVDQTKKTLDDWGAVGH